MARTNCEPRGQRQSRPVKGLLVTPAITVNAATAMLATCFA